jgi:hypothetical protein
VARSGWAGGVGRGRGSVSQSNYVLGEYSPTRRYQRLLCCARWLPGRERAVPIIQVSTWVPMGTNEELQYRQTTALCFLSPASCRSRYWYPISQGLPWDAASEWQVSGPAADTRLSRPPKGGRILRTCRHTRGVDGRRGSSPGFPAAASFYQLSRITMDPQEASRPNSTSPVR